LVTSSVFDLPFGDATFDCVVCTEVIEHVPANPSPLQELIRVLRPEGLLVISTPDYATPWWPRIERAYGLLPLGYADEHITHYTKASLLDELRSHGWQCSDHGYVFRSILVAAFRRSPAAVTLD
jgi:2-polyprenyl-3-methyl-5-hydroxy-6-metoxy-1,4-benzoquinol methylase